MKECLSEAMSKWYVKDDVAGVFWGRLGAILIGSQRAICVVR